MRNGVDQVVGDHVRPGLLGRATVDPDARAGCVERGHPARAQCRDDAGQEYEKFVDAGQLNVALDRLAKRVRLYGDEEKVAVKEGPALLIQINASPGAVNVTPTESNNGLVIDLPRPDKDLNR